MATVNNSVEVYMGTSL